MVNHGRTTPEFLSTQGSKGAVMQRRQYQHKESATQSHETNAQVSLGLNDQAQPLDASVRALLEPRFDHSFADVRVHAGPQAAQSAEQLDSRAYTVGQDIVMNQGEYNPNSPEGLSLLAHELTHTIQQPKLRGATDLDVSDPNDASEHEASRAARNAITGAAPVSVSSGSETAGVSRMISGAVDDWQLPSWGDVTGAVGGAISGGAGLIGGGISSVGGMAGSAIGGVGNLLGSGISTGAGFLGDAARFGGGLFGEGSVGSQIGDVAGGAISQIGGLFGGGVSSAAGNFGNQVSNGYSNIGGMVSGAGSAVGDFVSGMPEINPDWLLM